MPSLSKGELKQAKQLDKTMENLKEWITKTWAPIAGLLGAITLIVQFTQLWRGDQETVTKVIWVAGAILFVISLYYAGYSKKLSPIILTNLYGEPLTRNVYRYGKFSRIARTLFFLSILGIPILWGISIHHNNILDKKVVVLIANLDGPDPKNYRVTEQLLSQLSDSLSGYDDTVIIALGETITEQEGSKKAQDLGKNYRADLVIWGWYGVTESDVLLTIHVENLSKLNYLPLMPSNSYDMQMPAYEIKSFEIQQRLSSQMTALTLFLGGVIRYEASDYQNAIKRLSESLNEQWPNELASRKFVFFYRGVSYQISADGSTSKDSLSKAIADFSKVIEMDSGFWQAYYHRAMSYVLLNDGSNARKDYQSFLIRAPYPTNSDGYRTFAFLALVAGDDTKAIEYLNIAIEKDPKDALSLSYRSVFYSSKGEKDRALEDINRAIQLEPKFSVYYMSRAEIYRGMKKLELALKDINRALDLDTASEELGAHAIDLFYRGLIYNDMNEYTKAINDFSASIELAPTFYSVYYERGLAYLRLEELVSAIKDFSTFLQNSDPNDFTRPDAHYYRGVAFDEFGYQGYAFIDYIVAAEYYTNITKSWNDAGSEDAAKTKCKSAIANFQALSDKSKSDSIVQWANSVVKAFQAACPDTIVERIPTKFWLVELIINPIIPGSGLAGLKIGDTFTDAIERLDKPDLAYDLVEKPNDPNCCQGLAWGSDGLFFTVIFPKDDFTDPKVLGFRLEALDDPRQRFYVPFINNILVGTSEEELLSYWGNPVATKEISNASTAFSSNTREVTNCTELYYSGIMFGVCESQSIKERFVYYIEISNIDH